MTVMGCAQAVVPTFILVGSKLCQTRRSVSHARRIRIGCTTGFESAVDAAAIVAVCSGGKSGNAGRAGTSTGGNGGPEGTGILGVVGLSAGSAYCANSVPSSSIRVGEISLAFIVGI